MQMDMTADSGSPTRSDGQITAIDTGDKTTFIGGFERVNGQFLKEPSLYLSIAVMLMVSYVTFGHALGLFLIVFLLMTLAVVALHMFAEQSLCDRKAAAQGQVFDPYEGVLVLTFGSILPGLGLLGYSVYSLASASESMKVDDIGKIIFLLMVPIFNAIVWASVRKGYLYRPRLSGLMNGLAVGLSFSWTIVWLKCMLFSHGPIYCKFGWMFLLFASPFMFVTALTLAIDLWKKTEPRMAKITSTFCALGVLLSLVATATPMGHSMVVQSMITEARTGTGESREKSIEYLRSFVTDDDLRPSEHPVHGFGLTQLMIPNRGFASDDAADQEVYFKITGKSYDDGKDESKTAGAAAVTVPGMDNSMVGPVLPCLSLAKSQISGRLDLATMSSSMYWVMSIRDADACGGEARCEILLPSGAVVSEVVAWVDGKPIEAKFNGTSKAVGAYCSAAHHVKNTVLVTTAGLNKILVQCGHLTANGKPIKICLGLKAPLVSSPDGKSSVSLLKLLKANFEAPRRHLLHLSADSGFVAENIGTASADSAGGYRLDGLVKDKAMELAPIAIHMSATPTQTSIAVPISSGHDRQYIVRQTQSSTTFAPKQLFVVLDSSASLQDHCQQIKQSLTGLSKKINTSVYLVPPQDYSQAVSDDIVAMPLAKALSTVGATSFVGGQDNGAVLREALETASDTPNSAVLWIHGPQPIVQRSGVSRTPDLVNPVRFFDYQVQPGPNTLLPVLHLESTGQNIKYTCVARKDSVRQDLDGLLSGWATPRTVVSTGLVLSRNSAGQKISTDLAVNDQVRCLWASEEVSRLLASDQKEEAEALAIKHRLVTPVTGAVTGGCQSPSPSSSSASDSCSSSSPSYYGGGLVGAPVDPRFGQSNEVSQLADYGYDTARDCSRIATWIAMLVATFGGLAVARSGWGTKKQTSCLVKAIILAVAVPTSVHIVGTFMINNFGGLGGGL